MNPNLTDHICYAILGYVVNNECTPDELVKSLETILALLKGELTAEILHHIDIPGKPN